MSSQSLVNKESSLLGSDDNSTLFSIIGAKCISLSTAVIQLYLTKAPDHGCWLKKSAGVLCLIRDSSHRSYYFRVYCLQRKCLVWEQELYDMIDYKTHCDFFHYFEAENCLCAFNFANGDEAADFKKAVDNKLELRKQNKGVSRHRKSKDVKSVASVPNTLARNESNVSSQLSVHSANVTSSSSNISNNSLSSSFSNLSKFSKTFGAKKKKKRLSKNEISQPSNFQHLSYVKLTNDGSINTNMNSPELQAFFDKAGVSQQQLNDTKTRKFIYEFIDKYGGLDAVKKDISEDNLLEPKNQISDALSTECSDAKIAETAPPPVPARNFQAKNAANNRPLPPSPNRTLKNANKKPLRNGGVLPQQLPPPPPPPPPPPSSSSLTMTTTPLQAPSALSSSSSHPFPSPSATSQLITNAAKPTLTIAPNPRTKSDTKSLPITSSASMPAPAPASATISETSVKSSAIPPPPPPPLPPPMPETCLFEQTPNHQPIETNTSDNNSVVKTDFRSALLESIKSGITLNHVEPVKKTLDSPRSNLLLEIRQGVELKSVTPPSSDKKPILNDDSMAAVLARALAERARLMNPDTDSSSSSSRDDDDDDDDEWDD